jgi:vancomycin permeability regulator SanA
VLAYGQERGGGIDEQTKDRCRRALKLWRRGKVQTFYLTTCCAKDGVGMAEAMREFLMRAGVRRCQIVVAPHAGNTAGEMDVFLSLVPRGAKITFVSTWYHILRIIWLAMCRRPLRFKVVAAWRHWHWWADMGKEFLMKLPNALIQPYRSAKVLSPAPAHL